MTLRKYPLATLYTLLFFLSVLDYLTTVYCLENIPNCYETNPLFKTSDVMFKFKILYGTPAGIAGVLVGFAFDKISTDRSFASVISLYLLSYSQSLLSPVLQLLTNIDIIFK